MKAILSAFVMSMLSAGIVLGAIYLAARTDDATASQSVEQAGASGNGDVADVWRPHAIPADKENVRRVGPRFYPDPANALDFP